MGVTLYHFAPSAPSRAALLVANALGIEVDVKVLNLWAKEHLNPDFIKLNPQHTVPTLVDGDFVLWESKAIAGYLVRTYGKQDKLYPQEPKQKALVDQRLYFDIGTLYPREIEIPGELKTSLDEALGFLDVFLDGNDFVTGNDLTIADCALVASVSSIAAVGWDLSAYSNVTKWVSKCAQTIPNYKEVNQAGADQYGKAVRSKLAPGQI